MKFSFRIPEENLREICDIIPTPQPTEIPTEQPSISPTIYNVCDDFSLEQYLNQCYFNVDDISPNDDNPGIGCGGFHNCIGYFDGCNWCYCTDKHICTSKICPRNEYEDAYCTICQSGYVLDNDHNCVSIGSAHKCVIIKT